MRCLLLISLATLCLASASPVQPQNRIIAEFFGYFDTLRGIQFGNMLTITINFVGQIVESVPEAERGPASAALQAYVNRGRELRQRGSVQEKFDHVKGLQEVFENVQGQLVPSSLEANVIGMSMLGLLGVASEFATEDEKVHAKFVDGATKMKAKLTPETIARERELFGVIDELINSNKFYEHEPLIERFLSFKNRY